MTLYYGAWEYSGGNGMRVAIDVTSTGVTTSSTSVTYTIKVYTQNQYHYADPQVLTYGGNISGTTSYTNDEGSNSGGSGLDLRATKTYTYNYGSTSYGSSPGTVSFSASVSGTYNGVTPAVSKSFSLPARPYAGPTQPSGVAAVRNSDAQATVTWIRVVTAQRPYTSQTVQMRTYTGSTWSGWSTVATVSATATSYAKTGLSANHKYQFQVRSNNSVGSSNYVASAGAGVAMTPGAPTGASAAINAAGTQITVSWNNTHYADTQITMTVERSVNGAAYTVLTSTLPYTTTSYTDTAPGGGNNQYRVKAVHATGTLASAYSTSNTVTTIVPPLAPTQLVPNGVPVDLANTDVTLTWHHNPGTDGAAQSHFTIQYSEDGGGTWLALATNVASAVSSYTIPAGTLTNITRLWKVATQGSTGAAFGPYSSNATLIGSSKPTATITAPTATTESLPLTAAWDYNQDEGSAQSEWHASLFAADGTTLLESQSGSDASVGTTFTYPVTDQTNYVVQVQVRSAAGLWSDSVTASTLISLPPPAGVTTTVSYQPTVGAVIIHMEPNDPVGTEIPVDTVTVERRVDGGDWVTLVTGLVVTNDFIDPVPLTNGLNEYRVTSVSSAPSFVINDVVSVIADNAAVPEAGPGGQWIFLNYGDGFANLLRFRSEPEIKETTSRRKATQSFLGRRKPVLMLGAVRDRSVDVSGSLVFDASGLLEDAFDWDSPPQEWNTAGQEAEVVCLRDYTGRRVFGSIGEVVAAAVRPGLGSVAFSVVEIDYTESYGSVDADLVS